MTSHEESMEIRELDNEIMPAQIGTPIIKKWLFIGTRGSVHKIAQLLGVPHKKYVRVISSTHQLRGLRGDDFTLILCYGWQNQIGTSYEKLREFEILLQTTGIVPVRMDW